MQEIILLVNIIYLISQLVTGSSKSKGFNYGMFKNNLDLNRLVYHSADPKYPPPRTLDYRTSNIITPVKDQKDCSGSFAYSAIGAIEAQYANLTNYLLEFSVSQAFDCVSTGNCKTGGVPHIVMQSFMDSNVSCHIEEGYTTRRNTCEQIDDPNAAPAKVSNYFQMHVSTEDDLADALHKFGPLSVTMIASSQVQKYTGGLLIPTDCDPLGDSNHAVLLVGYGYAREVPYWIIKNSWGTAWGVQGYLHLIRGKYACNIGEYVARVTVVES